MSNRIIPGESGVRVGMRESKVKRLEVRFKCGSRTDSRREVRDILGCKSRG